MAQSILLAVHTKNREKFLSKQKLSLSDGRGLYLVCEQKLPKTKFWGVLLKFMIMNKIQNRLLLHHFYE